MGCIRSVIRSAGESRIPIIVADDSADDTNAEAMSALMREYAGLRWHRNERNLGIDGNICRAVSLCDADYAWLLGEDDLFVPDAVPRVLAALHNREPAFLFVNYSYVSNDYRYSLKERVVAVRSDQRLSAAEFAERYSWAMGFIGACVVDRRRWVVDEGFLGTYYAHVGSVLARLAGAEVTMVADPIVLNRAENSRSFTWRDRPFDVFFGWERMLRRLHSGHPYFDLQRALASSRVLFRHRSVAWLISKRADGLYDRSVYRKYIASSERSGVARAVSYLIALCPRALCGAAKLLARELPRRLSRRRIAFE